MRKLYEEAEKLARQATALGDDLFYHSPGAVRVDDVAKTLHDIGAEYGNLSMLFNNLRVKILNHRESS